MNFTANQGFREENFFDPHYPNNYSNLSIFNKNYHSPQNQKEVPQNNFQVQDFGGNKKNQSKI